MNYFIESYFNVYNAATFTTFKIQTKSNSDLSITACYSKVSKVSTLEDIDAHQPQLDSL